MANESLNGLSVTIEQNTPQTVQEGVGLVSVVKEMDTPQTVQEGVGLVSVVKEMDIPGTSEERLMSVSAIIGQESDNKPNVIFDNVVVTDNMVKNDPSLWMVDGFSKVVCQGSILI